MVICLQLSWYRLHGHDDEFQCHPSNAGERLGELTTITIATGDACAEVLSPAVACCYIFSLFHISCPLY
jgi:hypothetical protein